MVLHFILFLYSLKKNAEKPLRCVQFVETHWEKKFSISSTVLKSINILFRTKAEKGWLRNIKRKTAEAFEFRNIQFGFLVNNFILRPQFSFACGNKQFR